MPKKARMPRDIKAAPELVAAADFALSNKLTPNKAAETIKYLMMRRRIVECDGDLTAAGLKLGMSRAAIHQTVTLLEARLS